MLITTLLPFYTIEGITGNYNECISKVVTTADKRNCIAEENKVIDKQLNETYTKLLKFLSLSGKKKLKYSERARLKSRGEECKLSGHAMEGAIEYVSASRQCSSSDAGKFIFFSHHHQSLKKFLVLRHEIRLDKIFHETVLLPDLHSVIK
ncbi:DUF1311 domain-containing protein [Legionella sp. 27fs60]|uniref:DUF1311 domain-containing protein n=1 Tax=Legionella bononiensis TaxID=2793102 RepID=A0ABS1W8W4_9GAMM|nr:DUF1311 domain-containing protein [Legionella bononiensis]MBL7525786.1 DUF1311 domain-containing protein [Legionella bononiensis]MBL7561968.1 DUF1311 domain-containing protein [Legionella bononiensis]